MKFILVILVACSVSSSTAWSKVINGVKIDWSKYPEFVKLTNDRVLCSAVAVSKHHVVTNFHCAKGFDDNGGKGVAMFSDGTSLPLTRYTEIPGVLTEVTKQDYFFRVLQAKGKPVDICPKDAMVSEMGEESAQCIFTAKDLVIYEFDSEIKNWAPIAKQELSKGETVQFLGVGLNDLNVSYWESKFFSPETGILKRGENTIKELSEDYVSWYNRSDDNEIMGVPYPDGKKAGVGPGDSGGPVLNLNRELVAIDDNISILDPTQLKDISDWDAKYLDVENLTMRSTAIRLDTKAGKEKLRHLSNGLKYKQVFLEQLDGLAI